MSLQAIRTVLLAALHDCERTAARGSHASGDGMWWLREHSVAAFRGACGRTLKLNGFVGAEAFLEAVRGHREDPVVCRLAEAVEAVLGCIPGILFGIVKEVPSEVPLVMALEIVARMKQRLALGGLWQELGASDFEERWSSIERALEDVAMRYGFGASGYGVWCMLGACLAHRGDAEVRRWSREFESTFGLLPADWSLEQARAYENKRALMFPASPCEHDLEPSGSPQRDALATLVRTEAPLLQQHGFEVGVRGLIRCLWKRCSHFRHLGPDASAASSAPQQSASSDHNGASDPQGRISVLENLVKAKDRQIASLLAKFAEQAKDQKAVWSEVHIRDREISELSSQLAGKEAVVARLQAEVLAKGRSVSSLSHRIAEYSDELRCVRDEVLTTQKLIADLGMNHAWLAKPTTVQEVCRKHQEQSEAHFLQESLLEHMQSARAWRAEALEMYSCNAQLEAELQEIGSISHCARRCLGIEEEDLDWAGSSDHRRSSVSRESYGWSQLHMQFSSDSKYQLSSVELVQSRWVELACQSRLRGCTLSVDDVPSMDATKQRALDLLARHHVFGGPSNLVWAWHACDPQAMDKIARNGFAGVPVSDPGIFGNGHYMCLEAEYACKLATRHPANDERWSVLLVLVVLARLRPMSWCGDDFHQQDLSDPADCKYFGQRLQKHGAHIVPVQQRGGEYLIADGWAECHCIVLDDDVQVLPFAICRFGS